MKKLLSIALLLLTSVAGAGEPKQFADIEDDQPADPTAIRIIVPPGELEKGKLYQFPITGLAEAEFSRATADITPADGTTLQLSMTLDRKPFLWFQVTESKGYRLRIITNGAHQFWREKFDSTLIAAKSADVDEALLAEFATLAAKAETAYPIRSGVAVISVAGPRPPPIVVPPVIDPPVDPPPVVDPAPQPTSLVYAIIIRTIDTRVISALRQWTSTQPGKVAFLELAPDTQDPNGKSWVARVPSTATLPYLFVAKAVDGKTTIHSQGPLPETADEAIDRIEAAQTTVSKVDRVTYVYEKDTAHTPHQVAVALQKLNADSAGAIIATDFEEDTKSGRTDDTPEQYKVAVAAARAAGLPALVVESNGKVVRVVKSPTTSAQVLEAAR